MKLVQAMAIGAVLAVSACGSTPTGRAATGGLAGAVVGGPAGAVVGGTVGAATAEESGDLQ